MKVIKRDGRAVDYDRSKIQIAIEKANQEVKESERVSKEDILGIISYIEELDKKRILVEDIQDIIEQKIMELKKYELAKKYIVYRYTRALVRKQNTTDETILGIIRNDNKEEGQEDNEITVSAQRDYIAGEVSKDLTKRLLLPEKVASADEEGVLYFHDSEYFVHPMINSSFVGIGDMLDNGTVMSNAKIESPKSFLVACTVATQIMAAIANNQYGGQAIDMQCFGKYLRKSYEKFKGEIENEFNGELEKESIENLVNKRLKTELKSGIQIMQYQFNTLKVIKGRMPQITLFLHLDKGDAYLKENAMIIEEILKQRQNGFKDENGQNITLEFPKLIYVIDEFNNLAGGEYDYLTKLAVKCSLKTKSPSYISAKIMRRYYNGNVFCPMDDGSFLLPWERKNLINKETSTKSNNSIDFKEKSKFNQGIVSINLPQIAIIADGDEKKFWKLLEERLDICLDALKCRHYSLVGISSDMSPTHWQYGGIARLEKREKIDKLLYNGYSTLTLGYAGIYEMAMKMTGQNHLKGNGREFAVKVLEYLNETTKKWKKETNIDFILCGITSKKVGKRFLKKDKEKFGTIKGITDKEYYTGSYLMDPKQNEETLTALSFEKEFQKMSPGGNASYLKVANLKMDELEEILKYSYENICYLRLI